MRRCCCCCLSAARTGSGRLPSSSCWSPHVRYSGVQAGAATLPSAPSAHQPLDWVPLTPPRSSAGGSVARDGSLDCKCSMNHSGPHLVSCSHRSRRRCEGARNRRFFLQLPSSPPAIVTLPSASCFLWTFCRWSPSRMMVLEYIRPVHVRPPIAILQYNTRRKSQCSVRRTCAGAPPTSTILVVNSPY